MENGSTTGQIDRGAPDTQVSARNNPQRTIYPYPFTLASVENVLVNEDQWEQVTALGRVYWPSASDDRIATSWGPHLQGLPFLDVRDALIELADEDRPSLPPGGLVAVRAIRVRSDL